jgi:hypothetical protein
MGDAEQPDWVEHARKPSVVVLGDSVLFGNKIFMPDLKGGLADSNLQDVDDL